jgi:hypothetical protein
MAFITVDQPDRARLASMKGVSVLNCPLHRDQGLVAMVLAGVRCMDVRAEGSAFRADFHLRLGEWLPLADGDRGGGFCCRPGLRVASRQRAAALRP